MTNALYRLSSLILLIGLALLVGTPLFHVLQAQGVHIDTGMLVMLLLFAIVGGSMLVIG